MFSSLWGFVKRHKRKFIAVGVVAGGVYIAGRYFKSRFEEERDKATAELLASARMRHHFESNQRTCDATVQSLLASLREELFSYLDVESLTGQLRMRQGDKVQIWESLKVVSFARTVSGVYAVCLLVVFLRVQLNVVGRYMYIETLQKAQSRSSATDGGDGAARAFLTPEVQRQYLTFVQFFLREGLADLCAAVRGACEHVLVQMSLKELLSAETLARVVSAIRAQIEGGSGGPRRSFSAYLIPHTEESIASVLALAEDSSTRRSRDGALDESPFTLSRGSTPSPPSAQARSMAASFEMVAGGSRGREADDVFVNPSLRLLLDETAEIFDSADCADALTACMDTAFVTLVGNILPFFAGDAGGESAQGRSSGAQSQLLPLAKVIPLVNGQCHPLFSVPNNQFVDALSRMPQLEEFSAAVYSATSEGEEQ